MTDRALLGTSWLGSSEQTGAERNCALPLRGCRGGAVPECAGAEVARWTTRPSGVLGYHFSLDLHRGFEGAFPLLIQGAL